MNLGDLKIGQKAVVGEIKTKQKIKERLHSLGVITGVQIKPILKVPFGKIRTYCILRTTVAIRDEVARGVKVSVLENE